MNPESPDTATATSTEIIEVALFVTCLADLFRPSVAFDTIALLERAGCSVVVPEQQTCCGQPAYNTGAFEQTVPLAQQVIKLFEPYRYVVAPSGSCVGMIKRHYPRLLEGEWRDRAEQLADRTWELTDFLTEVVTLPSATGDTYDEVPVTYHDSCAGLRELGIQSQPRQLLQNLCGITVSEMKDTDTCCGFGGTFCAKMPELSTKMADDKLRAASASGAAVLSGGDLGCLLHLSGRASRLGLDLEFRHVAELLNGNWDEPAIGAPQD